MTQPRPDQFNVFNSRNKAIHSRKRRLIGQALSEHSLRKFEPTLIDQVDLFITNLLRAPGPSRAVNMTPSCRYLALDTIGQLGFGYDLKLQANEQHHFLTDAIISTNFKFNLASK